MKNRVFKKISFWMMKGETYTGSKIMRGKVGTKITARTEITDRIITGIIRINKGRPTNGVAVSDCTKTAVSTLLNTSVNWRAKCTKFRLKTELIGF
ncbi:MAG: hypothetical protein GY816_11625 [Cytophagales bacterium]|nr:hypothetical protein [Cytophagales bacterium]